MAMHAALCFHLGNSRQRCAFDGKCNWTSYAANASMRMAWKRRGNSFGAELTTTFDRRSGKVLAIFQKQFGCSYCPMRRQPSSFPLPVSRATELDSKRLRQRHCDIHSLVLFLLLIRNDGALAILARAPTHDRV